MPNWIQFVLESSACLMLFYLGYLLFLRKETYFRLNRFYLVLSVILSFIIPALKITSPVVTKKAVTGLSLSPMSIPAANTWGIEETLLLIYALGAGLFLTRFIFHMVKLFFVIRKFGVQRVNGLKIVSVDKEFSPFSFLNYIFINSHKTPENNMRRIIAHESIHIKQHHTLDILIVELATIVQWFNPFVWPYKKSLQETHEYLADCGVIAQGFSPAKYQLLMFEQHVGLKLFEFANNFKQSQIKRRITMMTKIRSGSAARLKLLLVLPLATLLVIAFAEPRIADPQAGDTLGAGSAEIKDTESGVVNSPQEEEVKKKKQEQAKKDLQMLYEKEKALREEIAGTEDPDKKAELNSALKEIREKQKIMEQYVKTGQVPPPPPSSNKLKEEYRLLSEKADAIKSEMADVKDAEEKAELKEELEELLVRQEKIKASLAEADVSSGSTLDKLKKEYILLSEKAAQIKEKLAQTEDPEVKAQLKADLMAVQERMQMIKAKASELEKEGKKIK